MPRAPPATRSPMSPAAAKHQLATPDDGSVLEFHFDGLPVIGPSAAPTIPPSPSAASPSTISTSTAPASLSPTPPPRRRSATTRPARRSSPGLGPEPLLPRSSPAARSRRLAREALRGPIEGRAARPKRRRWTRQHLRMAEALQARQRSAPARPPPRSAPPAAPDCVQAVRRVPAPRAGRAIRGSRQAARANGVHAIGKPALPPLRAPPSSGSSRPPARLLPPATCQRR